MRSVYILLFIATVFSCNNVHKSAPKIKNVNAMMARLKQQKDEINNYSRAHKSSFTIWVKITGKKELVKVNDGHWPDSIECTYNVLKGKKGNIIMIMSSPTSESGDWDLECDHYFDANGHTIVFETQANAFTSLPDDGVAYETTTDYFDPDFKLIKHTYKLVDKKGKKLNKELYGFDAKSRGLDQKALPTVKDCLTVYQLPAEE